MPRVQGDNYRQGIEQVASNTTRVLNRSRAHGNLTGPSSIQQSSPNAARTVPVTPLAGSTAAPVEREQSAEHNGPVSPPKHILDAYTSLFSPFYSIPPFHASQITSLPDSLPSISLVLALASYYRALPALRPHILTLLTSHHRELYRSIARSPPTYLLLSLPLQSYAIFKEAVIHIVARYPSWPWHTTPASIVPAKVMGLIEQKACELRSKREAVERYVQSSLPLPLP